MPDPAKPHVIAIEEHYADPAVTARADGAPRQAELTARLNDLGQLRLGEMDAAGIDMQVISHAPSPLQQLDASEAIPLARATNDRLHDAVDRHPERFAAFAGLPTADPRAAADELERTVTRLGFKGAMLHGQSRGEFHDARKFWPIFERAQHLDVPIYIHPAAQPEHGPGVLRRLPARVSRAQLRGLGVHHRHRQPGGAPDPERPVRGLPEPHHWLAIGEYHVTDLNVSHRLHLELLPEPFLGRPDAPVILLNLNPGFNDEDILAHSRLDFAESARLTLLRAPQAYPVLPA